MCLEYQLMFSRYKMNILQLILVLGYGDEEWTGP